MEIHAKFLNLATLIVARLRLIVLDPPSSHVVLPFHVQRSHENQAPSRLRPLIKAGSLNHDTVQSPASDGFWIWCHAQPMKLEPLHPVQIERFRQMTPVEKWNVALGLLGTARATRRAALRQKNPDFTETELDQALAKELSRSRT